MDEGDRDGNHAWVCISPHFILFSTPVAHVLRIGYAPMQNSFAMSGPDMMPSNPAPMSSRPSSPLLTGSSPRNLPY
jgi:hypothetical protein